MFNFLVNQQISSSQNIYFVCPSYGFISPVLSLIDKFLVNSPSINIIVLDAQMKLFWEDLIKTNQVNWCVIFIDPSPPGRFRNFVSWFNIKSHIRKIYDYHFSDLRNCCFFCCGSSSCYMIFSLMALLSKENTVIFLDISYSEPPKYYNFKSLFILFHIRFFYGISVTSRRYSFHREPKIYLSHKFFERLSIPYYSFKYFFDETVLKKYNPIPPRYTSGKKMLWLDDVYSDGYDVNLGNKIYIILERIKDVVDKKFTKDEILYKRHPNPRFHSKYFQDIYCNYDELPSYMNVDFVISSSGFEYVLGGFSAALSTAAKNSNIVAISYANLIPFVDENFKNRMVDYLVAESDGRVVFPDTIEDFLSLFV